MEDLMYCMAEAVEQLLADVRRTPRQKKKLLAVIRFNGGFPIKGRNFGIKLLKRFDVWMLADECVFLANGGSIWKLSLTENIIICFSAIVKKYKWEKISHACMVQAGSIVDGILSEMTKLGYDAKAECKEVNYYCVIARKDRLTWVGTIAS